MDAHTISEKIMKYWMCIYPKHSGEIIKSKKDIKVYVKLKNQMYEVSSVEIEDNFIKLEVIDKNDN